MTPMVSLFLFLLLTLHILVSLLLTLNIFHILHDVENALYLVMSNEWHDKKQKVNFKNDDDTAWLTNNCNTHIDQYLKKLKQSGNEIWSVNRI